MMMPQSQRGLTLIETLVWVAMFSMVLVAIVNSVFSFYRTNTYAVEQAAAVTSAQRGIESMIKYLREATYSSNGAYPIISMSTSSVAFYANIDDDPYIERVRFFVEQGSLKRGIIDPSGDPPTYAGAEIVSSVSDYVRNVEQSTDMFQFYDLNGDLMTDLSRLAEVRFVEATIIVNINPNRMPNQFTLRSTAAFRNLK